MPGSSATSRGGRTTRASTASSPATRASPGSSSPTPSSTASAPSAAPRGPCQPATSTPPTPSGRPRPCARTSSRSTTTTRLSGGCTRTVGAALTGAHPLGEGPALTYRLEAAAQADTGDNPQAVDADYLRADLGLEVGKVTVGTGYELLGGSPAEGAFQTPLATLHAFNGWADMFLTTPADGLRDLFVSCGAGLGPWKLLAAYHDFAADAGGADYGTEVDASVVFTTPWKQKLALEVARYDADRFATDTDKVFVWTQWGF